MTATRFCLLAAAIFAVVGLLQILRAVMGLPVTIGEHSIPVAVSWVAGIVALGLASLGYASSKR